MKISKRRKQTNAQNASKSTGPRTTKGKAKSSRNALKHGLLAKSVLLRAPIADEHQKDFDALLADLIADLQPRNMVEETLVERIATSYWRLRRAHRFEGRTIEVALQTPDPRQSQIDDLRHEYERQQKALAIEVRLNELLEIPLKKRSTAQQTELRKSLNHFAQINQVPPNHPSSPDLETTVRRILPDLIANMRLDARALKRKISVAQSALPQSACDPYATQLAPELLLKIARYETMLDRQIHRAMTELRRLRNASPQKVPDG